VILKTYAIQSNSNFCMIRCGLPSRRQNCKQKKLVRVLHNLYQHYSVRLALLINLSSFLSYSLLNHLYHHFIFSYSFLMLQAQLHMELYDGKIKIY